MQDTEAVQPLVPGVQQAAVLRVEGDEGQSAPCGSLGEQHAVPLRRQLLVQQRAEQLRGDGGDHVRQQGAVPVQSFGREGVWTPGRKTRRK